ncbi:MAG: hypothetical protein IIX04_05755, partial [Alistipes sp.]|nr:hypothetical protein [Alistipes sp.]
MKKLLLMLAAVGMIFTACEGGSPDDETNGNPTEQPSGNGNGGTYEDPNSPLTGIKCANNEILYI